MSGYRIIISSGEAGRHILPPHNTAISTDESGISDEVDQETAEACCSTPSWSMFSSPDTIPGETDVDGKKPDDGKALKDEDADDDADLGDTLPTPGRKRASGRP